MTSRLTNALMRALVVMALVATPSALLGGQGADGREVVALVALLAGVLTFVEYNAPSPCLIEFRDAPPFNRIRFGMLFAMIFALTVIEQGRVTGSTLSGLMGALGHQIGAGLDAPFSPVRLAMGMLDAGATEAQLLAVRDAAAVAYLAALLGVATFVAAIRLKGWPGRGGTFNVWVNLPTFDPTAGGDVVQRLERDARLNAALGLALPFVVPAVIGLGNSDFDPQTLTSPQTLIWTMTAWAFLPASLFMRGIAMARIAGMIREKRRQSSLAETAGFSPA